MNKVTLLTFLLLRVLCRRRWRRVRPGSLRWSSSSSNSKLSSWRGWKMPQPGPSWENLSMCCSPLWLSFWSLSQLWPIVWSPWWRHALAPSQPSSSSSYWPSCGETGTLSRGTHTALCSLQDDQIENSTFCFVGARRCNCSCSPAGSLKNVISVDGCVAEHWKLSWALLDTAWNQDEVEETDSSGERAFLFTKDETVYILKWTVELSEMNCYPSQNAALFCFYLLEFNQL